MEVMKSVNREIYPYEAMVLDTAAYMIRDGHRSIYMLKDLKRVVRLSASPHLRELAEQAVPHVRPEVHA